MPGRFYEQWTIGDRIAHQPHRTVTETDNLLISALTHNPQPLHLDADYAAQTEFGRIVVNGTFTFSLLVGLSVGDTTLGTLEMDRIMREIDRSNIMLVVGTSGSVYPAANFVNWARSRGASGRTAGGSDRRCSSPSGARVWPKPRPCAPAARCGQSVSSSRRPTSNGTGAFGEA